MALDLTNISERESEKISFNSELLPNGVIADTTLLDKWSALLLFADNDLEIDLEKVAESTNCNFIAIFDTRAKAMTANELLWLGAANTEPSRDITLHEATLLIDARPKSPKANNENPSRWPNIVTADEATIALVDKRWSEYGIGEFIPSPSKRYSALKLSEGAEWIE